MPEENYIFSLHNFVVDIIDLILYKLVYCMQVGIYADMHTLFGAIYDNLFSYNILNIDIISPTIKYT